MHLTPRLLAHPLTVTLTRCGFATVLLPWLAIGGLTKIVGLALSVGLPASAWPLSLGASYTSLPYVVAEGAAPTIGPDAFVLNMMLSELGLPHMVVAGLGGRVLAAQVIVYIWIASPATGQLIADSRLFSTSSFAPGINTEMPT